MTEFDNDLLAGLDDASPKDSAASKKQAAFEAKVDKAIKTAQSSKTSKSQRLKAVKWLGESGEPKAIPALVHIYSKESDRKLRDAAEYSLGMFRTLEDALDSIEEEQEEALNLLQGIVNDGKIGRRANATPYYLFMFILLLTFLGLATVAALVATGNLEIENPLGQTIAGGNTPVPSSTPLPPNPQVVGAELRTMYNGLVLDANTLQNQMSIASRGASIDCALTFNVLQPVILPVDLPADATADLSPIAAMLNGVQAQLAAPRSAFQQSCDRNSAIVRADANAYGDTIVEIQRSLNEMSATISTLPEASDLPPEPPLATATAEVVATATPQATSTFVPTVEPTAAVSNRVIQGELLAMQSVVDTMTNIRSGIPILVQYWNDVEFSGSTGGCREAVPTIPDDYVLSEEVASVGSVAVLSAVENINLGLALSRQAWEAFSDACAQGGNALGNAVAQQKIVATTAQGAFADAQIQISLAISELQ